MPIASRRAWSSKEHVGLYVDERTVSDHLLPNNDQAIKQNLNQKKCQKKIFTAIAQRFNIDEVHRSTSDVTNIWQKIFPNIHRFNICVTIWKGITIIATNISEKASETIKKFCTVRNGRNVKTDKITRIFPHIHKTTILERTSATGNALTNGIERIGDDDVELIEVKILNVEGDKSAILESLEEIKYQSILLIFNGKRISLSEFSFDKLKSGKNKSSRSPRWIDIVNGRCTKIEARSCFPVYD